MLELVSDTRVDLRDSGLRLGLGAFETVRVEAGRARWLDLHLQRLAGACAFLGLEVPPPAAAVAAAVPLAGLGVLRLLAADRALRVWAEPLVAEPERPLRIGLSRQVLRHPGPATRFKTLQYLDNLRLGQEARVRGLDEVVAPTPAGRLSDGGRSTLVAWLGGRGLTPPAADGALPGIGRRLLLEAGLVEEGPLTWADLGRAQAVALVSALRGLRPVAGVDGGGALDLGLPALLAAKRLLAPLG